MTDRSDRGLDRGLVLLMAVATGLAVANNYYAQPLLATIRRDFGIGTGLAGLIVTIGQVGYAAGLVVLLPLGDLLERRRLISLITAATAIGLLGVASAPTVEVLLPAMLWVGASSVVAQVLVPFAATLAGPAERGRVVGTVMSGLLLGVLLARTAAGYLAQLAGWRAVYLVAAATMLVLALVLRLRLPASRPDVRLRYPQLLASIVGIVREEPVVRRRAAFGGLSFAAFSVLWTTLAFLLAGPPYHYPEGTIGAFGLAGAAGAITASLAGRFADRGLADRTTGATALLLAAAYLPLWLGAHSLAALLVGIVVLDIGAQGLHITNQSEIYRLRPEARSRINAAYMTSYFAGGTVGSAGAALLYGTLGWNGVCLYGASFGVAALSLWLAGHRTGRRPPALTRG